MLKFAVRQLRASQTRTAALALGIVVAALSYVALGAVGAAAERDGRQTVESNFRTAYDILVRPAGSTTGLEDDQGLVQANYLSGVFGGISRQQYELIRGLDGVEVAAPIANVGYLAPAAEIEIPVEELLTDAPTQLFRIRQEWVAQQGLSVYPDRDFYVYVTDNALLLDQPSGLYEESPLRYDPAYEEAAVEQVRERLPDGSLLGVCGPVKAAEQRTEDVVFNREPKLRCFSTVSPQIQMADQDGQRRAPGAVNFFFPPILLAAIDPEQEAALLGLDDTVVTGRYLQPGEGTALQYQAGDDEQRVAQVPTAPVIASTETFISERLQVSIERLTPPATGAAQQLAAPDALDFLENLPGEEVQRREYDPAPAYEQMLGRFTGAPQLSLGSGVEALWTTNPVRYQQQGDRLRPQQVDNPDRELALSGYGAFPRSQPPSAGDTDFRAVHQRSGESSARVGPDGQLVTDMLALQLVGRFDPARLPGFSSLAQGPLQSYYPPELRPGDPAAEAALDGQPLLATMDLGGYQTQPPLMLTTLDAIDGFHDPAGYRPASAQGRVDSEAPISSIRVRVAGIDGPTEANRARIEAVADAIRTATGLQVDVTIGSSLQAVTVDLPAGTAGRPELTVSEDWVHKGVSFTVLAGLDRKSTALFVLTQAVVGLFVANGALAAVRSRRAEIGTLRALGWSRRAVFTAVLLELALIGLAAGVLGAATAAGLVHLGGWPLPVGQALAVAPIATAVAVLAGLAPAAVAAGTAPMAAMRPPVSAPPTARPVRTLRGMAARNLRRLPGRTALGALSLALGIAALTTLLAINLAYSGALGTTRLGTALSDQVRPVDYATAALAIALGVLSVADVLYLNLRERSAELTVLRTSGWAAATVRRLGVWEGLGIATLGVLAGTVTGLTAALLYAGPAALLPALSAAGLAGLAGLGCTALAAWAVVSSLIGGTAATTLAEAG